MGGSVNCGKGRAFALVIVFVFCQCVSSLLGGFLIAYRVRGQITSWVH